MSYIDNQDVFFNQIVDVDSDENDKFDDNLAPLAVAHLFVGGVMVVGLAAGAVAGYYTSTAGQTFRQPDVKLKQHA